MTNLEQTDDKPANSQNTGRVVDLETLKPNDTVHIRTDNSDYHIRVVDPLQGRALVQGGLTLVAPIESEIFAMAGDEGLCRGRIGVGLTLGILSGDKWVRTSRVRSIFIERGDHGPLL
jgi:hypothetical protein